MSLERNSQANRIWRSLLIPMIALWFLAILFSWFSPERGVLLIRNLMLPVLLMYSGAWLMKRGKTYHTEERLLFVLAIWYVITRMLNGSHYLETDADFACQLVVMVCVAFPLADNLGAHRDRGLKLLAALFAGTLSVIAWIAVIATVLRTPFQSPLSNLVIGVNDIYANPARLNVLDMHPNIAGATFCLAFGLTLYLLAALKSKWRFLPCILAAIGLFAAVALTLSRTAMIVLSLEVGGFGYLLLMRRLKMTNRFLQVLVSLLACGILVVASFAGLYRSISGMDALSSALSPRQSAASVSESISSDTSTQAANSAAQPADNGSIVDQSRLNDDVSTFAGRLNDIYPSVIPVLQKRQITLLIGNATDKVITEANRITGRYLYHWHNSFLQTLMTAGLPALLAVLAFTVLLVIQAGRLVFSRKAAFATQVLVLPVAGVFLHSMLENLLFVNVGLPSLLFILLSGFIFSYGRESSAQK